MAESPPALLPLFRSRNQLVLLAELFIHAGTERSLAELARATGIGKSVISHEVDRLVGWGIVRSERRGRLRLVDANPALPYFAELQSMLLKTMGPAARIRDALVGFAGIDESYIFGSWAARYHGEVGPPPRDVDLLVVGTPDLSALTAVCRAVSRELGAAVQLVVRSADEWQTADDDVFLSEVKSRPLVRIL